MLLLAVVARCLYDGDGVERQRLLRLFAFDRTVAICFVMLVAGLALLIPFIAAFFSAGYTYDARAVLLNHVAIIGMFLVAASVFVFVSMLLMHAVNIYQTNRSKTPQHLR